MRSMLKCTALGWYCNWEIWHLTMYLKCIAIAWHWNGEIWHLAMHLRCQYPTRHRMVPLSRLQAAMVPLERSRPCLYRPKHELAFSGLQEIHFCLSSFYCMTELMSNN